MLKNVLSSFFLEFTCSYLQEKTKLNLNKYNKYLQKNMNINIIDYKRFSGKYTIFENKIKGKTYNAYNNNVIYEGEFLNGEKNGKGKEYNGMGHLVFEGEFLHGKRNEYGIEYPDNNRKRYEGEFLNGVKNGKAKEFENDQLIFEGEYLNGKRWKGNIKEYKSLNELIFEENM